MSPPAPLPKCCPAIDCNVWPLFDASVGPSYLHTWLLGGGREPDEHSRIVGRSVTAIRARATDERGTVAAGQRNPSAKHVARLPTEQPHTYPMVSIADVVHEQPDAAAVVADEDILIAVVVDITEGSAAACFRQFEYCTSLAADIFETRVVQIAKQELALIVRKWLADAAFRHDDHAVDGQQIEPSVVVVIEPRSTPA